MAPLRPWMDWVLRIGGTFNLAAGGTMLVLYHECYKFVGLRKPELVLPIQLVGVLVALFGIGYWLVALNPIANRHLLMLGFLSKLFGSLLGIYYTWSGSLPGYFLAILFFADIIYLPPFAMIVRRLYRLAADEAP